MGQMWSNTLRPFVTLTRGLVLGGSYPYFQTLDHQTKWVDMIVCIVCLFLLILDEGAQVDGEKKERHAIFRQPLKTFARLQ